MPARLRKIWLNMGIRQKLTSISMCIVAVSLVITGVSLLQIQRATLKDHAVSGVTTLSKILAENSTAALAFNNEQDATDLLKSLRVEDDVAKACIFAPDKTVFAEYNSDKFADTTAAGYADSGYKFLSNSVVAYEPVILDDEVLGTVCVQSSLDSMHYVLFRNTLIITGIIFFALVLAYVLTAALQRLISRPLQNLAHVSQKVTSGQDYSIRATQTGNDEIGTLVESFNQMLDQIQARDKSLLDINKQLEEKVDDRTKDLSQMVERLNDSNKQLEQFTYVASHDLREPLRKIASFGSLLTASLEGKLDEDDQENLDFMIDAANRMQQMIEALLAYSRVTTRGVEFESLDLNEIMQQLIDVDLSMRIEENNAQVLVPEQIPEVEGDRAQIHQLLQNMVNNALKYQPINKEGHTPKIEVFCEKPDEHNVKILVRDNGIGIKPEDYENVFVMFRRLHSKSAYEGTGIGLAVCKRIVDRHRGEIGVESEYGKGSTFWFKIPLKAAKQPDDEPQEDQQELEQVEAT